MLFTKVRCLINVNVSLEANLEGQGTPSLNICLEKMMVCLSVLFPFLITKDNFFKNLSQNLIEQLPTGPNKFDINSMREFHKPLNLEENPFHFTKASEKTISDFLKELNTNEATGIDNPLGRFLERGSKVLANLIAQICNPFIKLSTVLMNVKLQS